MLDPFLGSGTTGKMALANGHRFIGCEISAEYLEISRQRIMASIPAAANDNEPIQQTLDIATR